MKQIKISAQQGKQNIPLSKEQKRFNSYVNKIKSLKQNIQDWKDVNDLLFAKGQQLILPVERKGEDILIEIMLALENHPLRAKLPAHSRNKLKKMLFEFAESAVFTYDRLEYKDLFDKYSKETFETKQQHEKEVQKRNMKIILDSLGIDVEDKDLEDEESFIKKMTETKQKMAEEKAAHAEKANNRKKTKAQIAKAEREKQAADTLNKTTKQIYRDLVQHFHPDREQDEQKREQKNEIMQQITAAYEADDFLKLLELQITLLEDRENAFGKFDDTQLKYFNNVLKGQVEQLEFDEQMVNPHYNGHPFGYVAPPIPNKEIAMSLIMKHIKEQQIDYERGQKTLKNIETMEGLKSYIKNYEISPEEDSFDITDLLRMLQ